MSICPEKDIHSVYLDGELPAAYVKEYEAHLESCTECRKHLESLKLVRAVFNADKKSMEMSQKDLDDSFERLQARLSFSRHTKSNVVEFKPKVWISAAIGAVAALALVFIPARLSSSGASPISTLTAAFKPVANVDIVSPMETLVYQVDGEVSLNSVANIFSGGETFVGNNDALLNTFSQTFGTVSYMGDGQASYGARASGKGMNTAAKLASYDIFTPISGRSVSQDDSWSDGAGEDESDVVFSLGSFYLDTQGE